LSSSQYRDNSPGHAYVPEGNAAISNNTFVAAIAELEGRVAALEVVLDNRNGFR
jgi:hypothetical protein